MRGLIRSLHGSFGFEPRGVLLMETLLNMSGYRDEAVPAMQRRMADAMERIPGVLSVGLTNSPPLYNPSWEGMDIYADGTADRRPSNAIA